MACSSATGSRSLTPRLPRQSAFGVGSGCDRSGRQERPRLDGGREDERGGRDLLRRARQALWRQRARCRESDPAVRSDRRTALLRRSARGSWPARRSTPLSAVPSKRGSRRRERGQPYFAGSLLAHEWNGKLERVTVLEKGFAWNGKSYGSLKCGSRSRRAYLAFAKPGLSWPATQRAVSKFSRYFG